MTHPLPALARRRFFGKALAAWAGSTWLGAMFQRPATATALVDDTPFIGEIRMFAGAVPPSGWLFCEGQLLQISQYDAFYNLIGTTYGGDGQTTFALPDLRGRVPLHVGGGGSGYLLGQLGGSEQVTLNVNQLPSHSHSELAGSALGTSDDPTGRLPARQAAGVPVYSPTSNSSLPAAALLAAGGTAGHENMQPCLGIHFMISPNGIYPSQF
jgi:microcystin-dependent protein